MRRSVGRLAVGHGHHRVPQHTVAEPVPLAEDRPEDGIVPVAFHLNRFVQIRREHFPDGRYPCSALLTISGFARPGIVIEIQGVAVI